MDHIFSKKPARRACGCLEMVNISGNSDAFLLHIICLDAVITPTVEILKRKLVVKYQHGTKKRFVTIYDSFLSGDKAVDYIGTT